MRKILFMAMFAVCAFASCTKESYFDVENAKVESFESANKATFDQMAEKYEILFNVCKKIIENDSEAPIFREVLPPNLLAKIDNKSYNLIEALSIIQIWWDDQDAGDCMVEDPNWDEFRPALYATDLWPDYDFGCC